MPVITNPISGFEWLPTAEMVLSEDPEERASQVANLRIALQSIFELLGQIEQTGNILELGDNIQSEQVHGLARRVGISTLAAREDHTHGTPPAGAAADYDFYEETPTGAIDGANVTYTLARAPAFIFLYTIRGRVLLNPDQYSIAGTTITHVAAPPAASTGHRIFYAA